MSVVRLELRDLAVRMRRCLAHHQHIAEVLHNRDRNQVLMQEVDRKTVLEADSHRTENTAAVG